MPNVLDYYEYAKLSAAAYVILDGTATQEKDLPDFVRAVRGFRGQLRFLGLS